VTTKTPRLVADCRPWCVGLAEGITHTVEWPCASDDHPTELSRHHVLNDDGVGREEVKVQLFRDHAARATTVHLATPPERDLHLTMAEAHRLYADLGALLADETAD
jgi:hypothetical protein